MALWTDWLVAGGVSTWSLQRFLDFYTYIYRYKFRGLPVCFSRAHKLARALEGKRCREVELFV
jgi:hypothetical protein